MNGFPTNPQQFGYNGELYRSISIPKIERHIQQDLFIRYELLDGLDGWATFQRSYDDRLIYNIEGYILSEERIRRYIAFVHSVKQEDFLLRQ